MPKFTIECSFDIPVYRHATYEAATVEEACAKAWADDDWSYQKFDFESAGDTRITGIWAGDEAYYGTEIWEPRPEPTFESVRALLAGKFDDAASDVMWDRKRGDTAPSQQIAIDAAIDLLAKALLEIRGQNG